MLDKLLSEENSDNIVMFDEEDREIEFEQVALIPLENALFAILKPITPIDGIEEDEAIVFAINEEEETLDVVTDEALATAVFQVYDSLFEDEEE
jgi:hypothetical protein